MAFAIDYLRRERNNGNYIALFINDDCIMPSDFVEKMRSVCAQERSIVAPVVVDSSDITRVVDAGVTIDWSRYRFHGRKDWPADSSFRDEVDVLPGRATFFPKEVFETIGNLDSDILPHYLCDYDFSLRARKAGFRIGITGETWIGADLGKTGFSSKGRRLTRKEAMFLAVARKSQENFFDHSRFIWRHAPTRMTACKLLVLQLARSVYTIFANMRRG
ncbi:glycosyltransferase family 2 protein [Chelatococcus daeguensis]|uniref:glycosyltransferase family 2 protein n=1 Tax=Chelatococcus daeguensis TaxID=444444 RepID=UPI0011AE5456|nr:glycosyltransferase family 2 protein [Chelatococcus daeguensis]